MADINSKDFSEDELFQAMGLLFFAYRDFVSDPDKVLAAIGSDGTNMGRAHHRVIHFVGGNPGMTVAQLLDILQITKQSLSRVLRKLVDEGYIRQEIGKRDARQRLLFLTEKGKRLEAALSSPQKERLRKAFAEAGDDAKQGFIEMLTRMINEEDRATALKVVEHKL